MFFSQDNIMPRIDTVIFDIGNVLIAWNPRRLFSRLLPDDDAIDRFFAETDFFAWNAAHDAGQSFTEGVAQQRARFPQYADLFTAFVERWEETMGAPIQGSVDLARELRAAGYRTFALTNHSAETFPRAIRRNPFLEEFEGIVVSGKEKLIKPDPAIYRLFCKRHAVTPECAVFIDDSLPNVDGALAVGMHALHFQTPEQIRRELIALGLPV